LLQGSLTDTAGTKGNRSKVLGPEPERRYTLLVVPNHGSAPSKAFAFSRRAVVTVLCCLVMASAALTWFVCSYRENARELAELRYMHEVAETQKQQIISLQEQCQDLSDRLRQTELTEAEIRSMLDEEGLLPQSADSEFAAASVRRIPQVASRNGLSNPRELLDREMESALHALTEITNGFEERLEELDSRVDDLHEEASETVDFYRAKPNMWPTEGTISSSYGSRRHPVTGARDMHAATDIAASYGADIKATADGVVTFAGYKYGYGYTVILSHKFGFSTLYAHCSRLRVSTGQEVKRGDVIANVGQSGTATGPHVHYEVRLNGETVDPEDGYLP
jgi:murein DD-endopeptidase MepM/ murein hydrolase activator NlpD